MTDPDGNFQQAGVFYAEYRSAIRWPNYFHMTLWAILLIAALVPGVTTGNPNWSAPIAITFMALLLSVALTVQNWPIGIQVAMDGIRVGAIRRKPNPPGKQPWADYQRWQQMFVPWDAVRRVAVITDKPGLREARRLSSRQLTRIGVLTAPFTRAALLIELNPYRATVPDFHEPHEKRPFWTPGHLTPFELSTVWHIPTRQPRRLRAVLAQHAAYINGTSSPQLAPYLRDLFERADVTGRVG